jgi:hypothetical protein
MSQYASRGWLFPGALDGMRISKPGLRILGAISISVLPEQYLKIVMRRVVSGSVTIPSLNSNRMCGRDDLYQQLSTFLG